MKSNNVKESTLSRRPALLKSASRCILSLVALFLVACNGGEPEQKGVVVNNDVDQLSTRVTMLNRAPKAPQHVTKMPEMLSLPADYIVLDESYNPKKAKNEAYYLPKGKKLTADIQFNENTYFVDGELTLTVNYAGQGTLVILPEGKVIYPADKDLGRVTILNYGEFVVQDNDFKINKDAKFMTDKEFVIDELDVEGEFYAPEVTADDVDIDKSGICTVECGIYVSKELEIDNAGALFVDSYLKAWEIDMESQGYIQINAGGLIEAEKLSIKHPSAIAVAGKEMEYAVIDIKKLELKRFDVKDMFVGWMDVHYTEIINNGKDVEWASTVKLNGDTYLPEAGCHPEFGKPHEIQKPEIGIEHIAEVKSPTHVHEISSTCIRTAGDKAYVSYHTRGSDYHGCIEVMEIEEDECKIVSYYENPTLDFNHLIVDNNRIVAAGDDPAKGAFLGFINLSNGIFSIADAEITQVPFDGASANCVIRNNAVFNVTTNAGYFAVDAETMETIASVPTPGSSKHVHSDGVKTGVLSLSDKNSESSMAKIDIYDDYKFSTPAKTLDLDVITPVNGKNVFQFDGDDIFVCLGRNGVKRYNNGNVVAEFKLDDTLAAANGLYVDAKYLYVAYGVSGLYVLDKNDLSVVASYRYSGGKSANYVTVENNIIYVAYGLSGVQIFKLVEKY